MTSKYKNLQLISLRILICTLILLLLSAGTAAALTINGINLPDEVTVSGKKLMLNGAGVKKKFFSASYVCGLYLQHPTKDATEAINSDLCKQTIIHFVQKHTDKKTIIKGWDEGFFNNSQEKLHELGERIATFNAFFDKDLMKNDRLFLSYTPSVGTTVKINDKTKGTITGRDFMSALWAIWLGSNPADGDLKEGMLGK